MRAFLSWISTIVIILVVVFSLVLGVLLILEASPNSYQVSLSMAKNYKDINVMLCDYIEDDRLSKYEYVRINMLYNKKVNVEYEREKEETIDKIKSQCREKYNGN